jgi:hypothetical protein
VKSWCRTIWYVLTLRCEEAERLRAAPDADALTAAQRLGERLHRALCSSCRTARRRLQALDEALSRLAATETGEENTPATAETPRLDDAARARILARLSADGDPPQWRE